MGLYRITVKTTFPGGTTVGTNTWHFRSTSVPIPTAPDITNTIKAFYDGIKANFGSAYSWAWDGVISEVATATPQAITPAPAWTVTGSSGGNLDTGPSGVGLVVGWRSSLATRRGRGRTFIAPLPVSGFEANGTIAPAMLTAVRAAAAALVSTSTSNGNGAVSVFSQVDNVGRDVVGSAVVDRVAYLSSRRS